MFEIPTKGLIIREPWISMILDGMKTWELRSSSTAHRGRVALIASGTATVLGEVNLVGARGPLTRDDLANNVSRHQVERDWETQDMPYKAVHAWILERPVRYASPVPYIHPKGAVIWVNLPQRHGIL